METWTHLHLPRLQASDPNPISIKIPGQRTAYASWVSLKNARFHVSEAGRRRCLKQNVRNVHAWVIGEEILRVEGYPVRDEPPVGWRRAVYNPWKGSRFVDAETLESVETAESVIMSGKNVYYLPAGE